MAVEVFVHKMTEHMDRARIVAWRVQEGDAVEQYQIILDVETEKAAVELEAPAAGIIKGVRKGAEAGAEVPVGAVLAYIAAPDESVPALPPLGTAVETAPAVVSGAAKVATARIATANLAADAAEPEAEAVRATPIARKAAKDLGVDLRQVPGSGPRGRIREEDVRAYAAGLQAASLPAVGQARQEPQAAAHRPTEEAGQQPVGQWLDLTSLQRLTGERMLASVQSAPQFMLEISVDAANLLWLRETLPAEPKISVTALLIKAAAQVLRKHPRSNAAFCDGRVQVYADVNVGVAVGSEQGLVVPVIRAADQKTLGQIQQALDAAKEKAAANRFTPADLTGGTFTLSNLGMYGIERFNAILNPPQSAILAVGKIIKTPVALADDSIGLRPVMRLMLTVDHRVLDGLQGARFLADLKDSLETLAFLV